MEMEMTKDDAARKYREVFGDGETKVECNEENVSTLLRYLNTLPPFGWATLPYMTIGYAVNSYDCGGQQATAIVLDKAIEVGGELTRRIVIGAPRRHLVRYTHIRK